MGNAATARRCPHRHPLVDPLLEDRRLVGGDLLLDLGSGHASVLGQVDGVLPGEVADAVLRVRLSRIRPSPSVRNMG